MRALLLGLLVLGATATVPHNAEEVKLALQEVESACRSVIDECKVQEMTAENESTMLGRVKRCICRFRVPWEQVNKCFTLAKESHLFFKLDGWDVPLFTDSSFRKMCNFPPR